MRQYSIYYTMRFLMDTATVCLALAFDFILLGTEILPLRRFLEFKRSLFLLLQRTMSSWSTTVVPGHESSASQQNPFLREPSVNDQTKNNTVPQRIKDRLNCALKAVVPDALEYLVGKRWSSSGCCCISSHYPCTSKLIHGLQWQNKKYLIAEICLSGSFARRPWA